MAWRVASRVAFLWVYSSSERYGEQTKSRCRRGGRISIFLEISDLLEIFEISEFSVGIRLSRCRWVRKR